MTYAELDAGTDSEAPLRTRKTDRAGASKTFSKPARLPEPEGDAYPDRPTLWSFLCNVAA